MTRLQSQKLNQQQSKLRELKDAIYLKCLDCCCWQTAEPMKCTAKECPLYPLRPKTRIGEGKLYRKMMSLKARIQNE